MNKSEYVEFLKTPAPDPDGTNNEVWFDVITVGNHIAGIAQRLTTGRQITSVTNEELEVIQKKHFNDGKWIHSLDPGTSTKLQPHTRLFNYAELIQRICDQLTSNIKKRRNKK